MNTPHNKQLKDLFEGLLGRPCTIGDAADRLPPDASPRSVHAVYVDPSGRMSAVAIMEFSLAAHTGAALALIPVGGAEAALEDRFLPANLMENTAEVLNVLAAPIGESSGVHQRLADTYGPQDDIPAGVAAVGASLGVRTDVLIEIEGYGADRGPPLRRSGQSATRRRGKGAGPGRDCLRSAPQPPMGTGSDHGRSS